MYNDVRMMHILTKSLPMALRFMSWEICSPMILFSIVFHFFYGLNVFLYLFKTFNCVLEQSITFHVFQCRFFQFIFFFLYTLTKEFNAFSSHFEHELPIRENVDGKCK